MRSLLKPHRVIFMECDIQEPLRKLAKNFREVVKNAIRVAEIAEEVKSPLISTQHDPRVYGRTALELARYYDGHRGQNMLLRHTKYEYSMLEPPILNAILDCPQRDQIILFGALTEVCVRKTCFDLLTRSERPFQVSIVADAVMSIQEPEKEIALKAMREAGAQLTTISAIQAELGVRVLSKLDFN